MSNSKSQIGNFQSRVEVRNPFPIISSLDYVWTDLSHEQPTHTAESCELVQCNYISFQLEFGRENSIIILSSHNYQCTVKSEKKSSPKAKALCFSIDNEFGDAIVSCYYAPPYPPPPPPPPPYIKTQSGEGAYY